MPRYSEQEWFQKRREWAAAHPGHCPTCGLPDAHCYDQNPAYRGARSRVHGPSEISGVIREWHRLTLRRMTTSELKRLPPPPSRLRASLVVDELECRGAFEPVVRRSVWQRLMGEDYI